MASGATLAPQPERPDPPIDGHSGDAPPKPTNFLELGWETLSSGTNEAPHPKAQCAPHTLIYGRRGSALEGWLERIRTCYRNPQKGMVLRMIRWP